MPFNIAGEWVPEKETTLNAKGPLKIFKEKRGNSIVTIIHNIPLAEKELKNLCSTLKQRLGCGGSLKEGIIELQGDKIQEVKQFLKNQMPSIVKNV